MEKRIILTGGGTAGHVTPHIALLPALLEKGYKPYYIGSHNGIERQLIVSLGIDYYPISSGKLRRYPDIKNFTDMFRVIKGWGEAMKLLRKLKPHVVFSKGGFVAVPVTLAAYMLGIPVVLHESDITPGLANRIALPFAKAVCCSFPETPAKIPAGKGFHTGTPIRAVLHKGSRYEGRQICGFERLPQKPVIMFMGGSSGAGTINALLAKALPRLLEHYHIIHLCGKGNITSAGNMPGIAVFEYVNDELPHLYALADVVVSRAGANSLFEILALRKPNLLIPLPLSVSRGDQILNAEAFRNQGFSVVLHEEALENEDAAHILSETILRLYADKHNFIRKMNAESSAADAITRITTIIEQWTTYDKT